MAQDSDGTGLAAVAAELYALPPEGFTAARDAAAKAAPAHLRAAVKALRRPTVAAALVNALARQEPDLLDSLLELGPALAEAQAAGSGDDLRALGRQRRELVAAVTQTAVGDRDVTAAVRTDVEHTLEAALADPAAADAVRSGTLVRALSFAGFGGVDVEGAVAVSGPRPARRPPAKGTATDSTASRPRAGQRAVQVAEQRALDAAAELDDAVRGCEQAERRAQQAADAVRKREQAREAVQEEVDELESRLSEARERLAEAGHRAHDAAGESARAEQARDRARRRVAEAQESAEQARAALDGLRRGS